MLEWSGVYYLEMTNDKPNFLDYSFVNQILPAKAAIRFSGFFPKSETCPEWIGYPGVNVGVQLSTPVLPT